MRKFYVTNFHSNTMMRLQSVIKPLVMVNIGHKQYGTIIRTQMTYVISRFQGILKANYSDILGKHIF